MDAYTEAMAIVRDNAAALSLVRSNEHHTENCQRGRVQAGKDDVCFCDLPVHLAEIISEARGGRY